MQALNCPVTPQDADFERLIDWRMPLALIAAWLEISLKEVRQRKKEMHWRRSIQAHLDKRKRENELWEMCRRELLR